jgi:hypothetical protein
MPPARPSGTGHHRDKANQWAWSSYAPPHRPVLDEAEPTGQDQPRGYSFRNGRVVNHCRTLPKCAGNVGPKESPVPSKGSTQCTSPEPRIRRGPSSNIAPAPKNEPISTMNGACRKRVTDPQQFPRFFALRPARNCLRQAQAKFKLLGKATLRGHLTDRFAAECFPREPAKLLIVVQRPLLLDVPRDACLLNELNSGRQPIYRPCDPFI